MRPFPKHPPGFQSSLTYRSLPLIFFQACSYCVPSSSTGSQIQQTQGAQAEVIRGRGQLRCSHWVGTHMAFYQKDHPSVLMPWTITQSKERPLAPSHSVSQVKVSSEDNRELSPCSPSLVLSSSLCSQLLSHRGTGPHIHALAAER